MGCQIDIGLVKLKFLYFFELSIYSILITYLSPFMNEWGVTVTELAVISFVAHIGAFVLRPSFGYIADKYQNYKLIIISLSLSCGICFVLNLASPKYVQPILYYALEENLTISTVSQINSISICHLNYSIDLCWPTLLSNCSFNTSSVYSFAFHESNKLCANFHNVGANNSIYSDNSTLFAFKCLQLTKNCNSSKPYGFVGRHANIALTWSSTFWILGLLKIIGFGLFSPLSSLTDSLIFIILGKDRSKEYGFTRMFGTIGILLFAILTGGLMYSFDILATVYKYYWVEKIQSYSQFTVCFVLGFIVFMIVVFIVAFIKDDKSRKAQKALKSRSCLTKFVEIMSLKLLFQDFEMAAFFIFVIFGGLFLNIHADYYMIVIYRMFPLAPKYIPGLLLACMTLSETFFLGISERMLKLFCYELWVSLTFIFWSVRWLAYTFCTQFWHFLIIEIIHGLTYGLQICAMLSFIGNVVSQSDQGKVQGLFSSLFYNIGGCLGGLIGGIILDNFGAKGLFTSTSVMSLICGLVYYPLQVWIISRRCKGIVRSKFSESLTNDNLLLHNKEIEILN